MLPEYSHCTDVSFGCITQVFTRTIKVVEELLQCLLFGLSLRMG